MSILDIVSAISTDVVAKLAAAGLPPLIDGQIVVGLDKADETTAVPRIVFIPHSFRYEHRDNPVAYAPTQGASQATGAGLRSITMTQYGGGYSGTPTVSISAPDVAGGTQATATATLTTNGCISGIVLTNAGDGYLSQPTVTITGTGSGAAAVANLRPHRTALNVISKSAFATAWHKFEVRVWSANSVGGVLQPDPALDYAATQSLFDQVLASAWGQWPNLVKGSNGIWADASPSSMNRDSLGKMATFFLEISIPVLREPIVPTAGASVQFVPVGTQPNPSLFMLPSSGGAQILAATNASPIQITSATPHGLTTGNTVSIAACAGNTNANGIWTVTVSDATHFTLNGSTGNGAYTGGGFVFAESA